MKKSAFTFLLLIVHFSKILATCATYKLSLDKIIQYSSQIVEGKITSYKSYFSNNGKFIYTKYSLEVNTVFWGSPSERIDFIAEGGVVENVCITSSIEKMFSINESGIFFLSLNNDSLFQLSCANQSYFSKNNFTNNYSNGELIFSNFGDSFYSKIETSVKRKLFTFSKKKTIVPVFQSNPLIQNLSPTSITAGTESLLTITGSGFGTSNTGLVFFTNADDGGATFFSTVSSSIQSWNDTRIVLKVPSQAGTGKIMIQQNGVSYISSQTVTINYSRSNVESGIFRFKTTLVNESEAGGYLINLNSNFDANDKAKARFIEAFKNWRCNTFVNFTLSETTDVNVRANDNISVVRFANPNELKPGVLGITYCYYVSCSDGYWFLKEFDMLFLDFMNWNLDSSFATNQQYDFQSIVTHELGHAHQLGHVIDPNNVMHYSINYAENKREIDSESLSCISTILNESIKTTLCGPSAMKALSSGVCYDAFFTFYALEKPILTPNPATSELLVSFFLPSESNGVLQVFDSKGLLVSEPFNGIFSQGKNEFILPFEKSNFSNGMYMIKLSAMNKNYVTKFLVQK